MKFLVLFLATAALASATFIGGKYIDIKEDGTIYIKGDEGKQIYITKHFGPNGKTIEIEVTGPNDFTKMFQFDYHSKNYQGQYDILDVIFREYLGYVDEATYQQLLQKVQKAVLEGYFDGKILYVLQTLVEGSKWDSLISGQSFQGQIGEVLNKMTQQNKYGLGFYGKLFKGRGFFGQEYNQYDADYYYNILMKIFDRKVLKNILIQGQMYNQEMYGQYSYEKIWDMIFTQEGIFDSHYLVEIINNPTLRSWFVQRGYFDKVVLDKILVAYKTEGVYDQYLLQRLVNTQVLKYFYLNHRISVYDILGQTTYQKYDADYYYRILMKIFDRKVLKTVLNQEQMYNQEMYGQYSYERMWEMIFNHEGIFDSQYLVEIINNPTLRTWFVQRGYFDKVVLDKILVAYKTEGVYDQYLLQRLFNTQVLKYFFLNHRISVYDILGQITYKQFYGNTFFNKGFYSYNMLEKFINDQYYRNVMVQYGIFNREVLDQILYRYSTEGVYDQVLLRQLVNKQALYKYLVQYGVVDQTMLRQFVDNEYLGLNYLFKSNFFQQTPRMSYQTLFGGFERVPEYNNYRYGGNYLNNFMYGQQYYGYKQGPYNYGKLYNQYPLVQPVY